MKPDWNILQAMLHCRYKAWQLAKSDEQAIVYSFTEDVPLSIPVDTLSSNDKLVLTALYQGNTGSQQTSPIITAINSDQRAVTIKPRANSKKAQVLWANTVDTINEIAPPAFYRNAHCPDCKFHDACYQKLKERDCISLLSGMSPKVILKFQKKGIYSIAQLSHLFRPRRRRRHPQVSTNYLWELKALAITEQKTFVLYPPDVKPQPVSIYIDFEGLPDEGWIYLIAVLIKKEDEQDIQYSFWADSKENESAIFTSLLDILKSYSEATIYHYGSYETKAFKQIQKKNPQFKNDIAALEPRLINLLGFLRTHIYPPIYSNGLKELGGFLGYKWAIEALNGQKSIHYRKGWELTRTEELKDSLLRYNLDDCHALSVVKRWFEHLATNAAQSDVQQVSEMKRQSMYKLQNNPELGEDFQFISKAAYFDYQRSKIYLKNKTAISRAATTGQKPKANKKGVMVWQPKKSKRSNCVTPITCVPQMRLT